MSERLRDELFALLRIVLEFRHLRFRIHRLWCLVILPIDIHRALQDDVKPVQHTSHVLEKAANATHHSRITRIVLTNDHVPSRTSFEYDCLTNIADNICKRHR